MATLSFPIICWNDRSPEEIGKEGKVAEDTPQYEQSYNIGYGAPQWIDKIW